MEDIQNVSNLGEFKEWVIWKEKGTETRKEIEKLWTNWEDKGLISNDRAAQLPNPASIMCIITHGTREYNEAKAGKREENPYGRKGTVESKKVKSEI